MSPLAGDINWMETEAFATLKRLTVLWSPLAGDINWMETHQSGERYSLFQSSISPHSLGTLIEWKLNLYN